MAGITYELLNPRDQDGFHAAMATYWKSFLAFHGVEFGAELSDVEVLGRAQKHLAPNAVQIMAQQFRNSLKDGHVVVAKNAAGKTVAVANYTKFPAAQLNIQDNRSTHVALINNYKVLEHKGDIATAKGLLIALLDVIDQSGLPRIVFGKSYDERTGSICLDHMFGSGKMGFEDHTNSPFSRPDGCLVIAGVNGAYAALNTIRSGSLRAPTLQL